MEATGSLDTNSSESNEGKNLNRANLRAKDWRQYIQITLHVLSQSHGKEIAQELIRERALRQHERKARMFCATGNNPVTSEDWVQKILRNTIGMSWGKRVRPFPYMGKPALDRICYFILVRMAGAMITMLIKGKYHNGSWLVTVRVGN